MPILLLTRPLPQAVAFLARVGQALGHEPAHLIAPLSVIEPTGAGVPPGGDLILTSGRTVELAGDLTGRRAWCVGQTTAQMARAAGAEAISADADVEALFALICARASGPLTHLRGADSAGNLVARLRAAGHPVEERVMYQARRLPLSAEAKELLASGERVLAPVFSPRAGQFLAEEAPVAPSSVVAISAAAARPFGDHPDLTIVANPDGASMLAEVVRRLGNLS